MTEFRLETVSSNYEGSEIEKEKRNEKFDVRFS